MPYKNLEKAKKAKKDYRLSNPNKVHESQRRSREKNVQYRLWKSSKDNAKRTDREHSIVKEDIVIPEYCPYLNIKLTNSVGGRKKDSNVSLDRLDNNKGYTKENIQVISWRANRLKSNLTEEELVIFANNILNIHVAAS